MIIAPDVIRLMGKKFETLAADDFKAYERMNRISGLLRTKIGKIIEGLADIEVNSTLLFSHYLSRRIPEELPEHRRVAQ